MRRKARPLIRLKHVVGETVLLRHLKVRLKQADAGGRDWTVVDVGVLRIGRNGRR